jgi:hypothetical protein
VESCHCIERLSLFLSVTHSLTVGSPSSLVCCFFFNVKLARVLLFHILRTCQNIVVSTSMLFIFQQIPQIMIYLKFSIQMRHTMFYFKISKSVRTFCNYMQLCAKLSEDLGACKCQQLQKTQSCPLGHEMPLCAL